MSLTPTEEIEYLTLLELEDAHRVRLDWEKGDLRFKLHAAQRKIYDVVRSTPQGFGKDVVVLCARRFGKSYLNCILALEDCIRNPGCIVRIIGPELYQTIEIVDFHMQKIRRDAPIDFMRPRSNGRIWEVAGSQVIIGGFDRKNVSRNLGKEALNIYTEEACASSSDEFKFAMREVVGPQLFHSKGRFVHATTPPSDLNHTFITEFVPKAAADNLFFLFTINDNPLADAAMRADAAEKSGGEDTVAYKRNYLCQFVREDEKSIVPLFHRVLHVAKRERPQWAHWTLGIDLGFARDHSAAVLSFYDTEAREHVIFDAAIWRPGTSTATIVRECKALEARHGITRILRVVDDDPRSIADLAELHAFPCVSPSKDTLNAMLAEFNVAFGNRRVVIDPRCEALITALEAGMWNERRTDFERTEALGHWDAGMAALYGFRAQDKRSARPPFPNASETTHYVPETPTHARNIFGWDKNAS